jgi:hypothetical protein
MVLASNGATGRYSEPVPGSEPGVSLQDGDCDAFVSESVADNPAVRTRVGGQRLVTFHVHPTQHGICT